MAAWSQEHSFLDQTWTISLSVSQSYEQPSYTWPIGLICRTGPWVTTYMYRAGTDFCLIQIDSYSN
jgi:hypothetical protein